MIEINSKGYIRRAELYIIGLSIILIFSNSKKIPLKSRDNERIRNLSH